MFPSRTPTFALSLVLLSLLLLVHPSLSEDIEPPKFDATPDEAEEEIPESVGPVKICKAGVSGCGRTGTVGFFFAIFIPLVPGLFLALKYLVDTWDAADYENHLRRINEANEAALYQHPNNEARRMTVQPQLYQQIHQQERGRIELPPLPAGRGGAERSAPVDRGYRPDASAEQQAPTVADIRAMAASMQGPPSPAAAAVPGPASVPAAQSTTPRNNYHRFCTACGMPNESGLSMCPGCGASLAIASN